MNKRAIVTGASRGIGRGIALALAAEGYDLAISYATQRNEAEAVAARIKSDYGRQCFIYRASLNEHGEGKKLTMPSFIQSDRASIISIGDP